MFSSSVCDRHCFAQKPVSSLRNNSRSGESRYATLRPGRPGLFFSPCPRMEARVCPLLTLRCLFFSTVQHESVNALHKERGSLCSTSRGTSLCDKTKSVVLGARRLKFYNRGGGVFRDTGASMKIYLHRECFCMKTVTRSASDQLCHPGTHARLRALEQGARGRNAEAPGEDTHALPFAGKEKRRDLTFRDAEWRTWTLQSANCCAKSSRKGIRWIWAIIKFRTELGSQGNLPGVGAPETCGFRKLNKFCPQKT